MHIWHQQCPLIDNAFGSVPHRSPVSHFIWGDRVRDAAYEDNVLQVRRRLLIQYHRSKPALCGKLDDPVPVVEDVEVVGVAAADVRQAGAVREHVADGDALLAAAGELRDVLAHAIIDVDLAAVVEQVDQHRRHGLRRREDADRRLGPGEGLGRVRRVVREVAVRVADGAVQHRVAVAAYRRALLGETGDGRTSEGAHDDAHGAAAHAAVTYALHIAELETHVLDTIIADLETSEANLPAGTLLGIGSAVIRVSDVFNDGCVKWKARYGKDAKDWITAPGHPPLRLRGILCSVEQDGVIACGDLIHKLG